MSLLLAVLASAAGMTLASRWGVWRWLCLACVVPGALALSPLSPGEGLPVALLAIGLLLLGWRRQRSQLAGFGLLVVAAGLVTAYAGTPRATPLVSNGASWWWLGPCLGLALAGAVGAGRSALSPLRWQCLLAAAAPAACWAVSGSAAAPLSWWPVAGALGSTAVLRARRGHSAARPQHDVGDDAAAAAFDATYARPHLPPVTIVIAAYDEEAGIGAVLDTMPADVCGLAARTLVVDDGSSDGTADAAARSGRALVVRCGANRGQGAALRLGYRIARDHGARYVITTDADGQYDVADMPVVLRPLLESRADFVTGSRRLGHQPVQDPLRRLGVYLFAALVSVLTGHWLTDTSFGLRAMRADLTEDLTLNQPQYQSAELLIGVLSHGHRVVEVPGTMHVRVHGSSKKGGNWSYGRRYAGVVLGTWWREGCPAPVDSCPAMRSSTDHGRGLSTRASRADETV